MNIAVRYHTRSGNTRKIAQAIALALGVEAHPLEVPMQDPVQVLFLGGAVYAVNIDENLQKYLEQLDPKDVQHVAVFSTAAIRRSAYPEIKEALDKRGIDVLESNYHCRGNYTIFHKNRPNEQDELAAAAFAKNTLKQMEGAHK